MSKLTKENIAKIKFGMTIQQVEDIIGPHTGEIGVLTGRRLKWQDGRKSFVVGFKDGKVSGTASYNF
jgi:hypothetical protein